MVTILATVNSIVPSALCKLLFTNFCLVSRLGNTLSAESKNQGIKSFKILLIHKIVFYLSDLVVFQSKSMKEDAVKVLNLKDSSKFIVINNGIDFTEVSLNGGSPYYEEIFNWSAFLLLVEQKRVKNLRFLF